MKQTLGLFLWAALVLAGFAGLTAYSTTPAQTLERTAMTWPAAVSRGDRVDSLVVFLHPKCGCSRATLAELETLIPELGSNVEAIVYFYFPSKSGEVAARGKLFEIASRNPQLEIRFDEDAKTADLFRARASGEAMYFAADGALKFHGGLTPLRGHGGDNVGRRSILSLAKNESPESITSKVFGCQLKEELAAQVTNGVARVQ